MKTFAEFQESVASIAFKGGSKLIPALMTGIGATGTLMQIRKRRRNKDKSGESGKSLEQRVNAKNSQGAGGSPGQVYAGKNRDEKGDPLPDVVKQKIIDILNKNKKK